MQKVLRLLGLGDSKGKKSLEGDSHKKGEQDFVLTESERDLLARFGGKDTTPFKEVHGQLADNNIPEERRGKVWEMIRGSRSEFQSRSGNPERHS